MYNYHPPIDNRVPKYLKSVCLMIATLCLVALTFSLLAAVFIYKKESDARIAAMTPAPTLVSEVKACTTEQAMQWWTNTTDMVSVRNKMCGNIRSKKK